MKPMINIKGHLIYPVQVGCRAFIHKNDANKSETLLTSQVVDVRNQTADSIEIETKNTIYKVTFYREELPLAG